MKQAIIKLAAQWFSARTPEKRGGGGRPAERPNVFEFACWSRPQPTLIVDRDEVTAKQLAEQLGHCGFETDFANSYVAAEGAVRTKYYRTIIVVIESDSSIDWDGLSRLRKRVLGSWIIVATSPHHDDAHDKIFRFGGDSLLATQFSVEDLTTRLSAFSLRSRPI